MSFIEFENVSKTYGTGDVKIRALKDISFEIEHGEICAIVGQSGAGKTTLLNILGGMDVATKGSVYLNYTDIASFTKKQLATYRRDEVGFVFQFYNLLPNLTALENVELATQLTKDSIKPQDILDEVGLKDRLNHFPGGLSGGEQQRVAIARALAKRPKLLLCDEPTGALDCETGKSILKLLQETSKKNNMTIIIVTHNMALTAMADRVIRLKSGSITESYINWMPAPVEQIEW